MKNLRSISAFYILAALYDGILGIVFLIAAPKFFEWAQVIPPNHFGYVQFPAALLIVFALMFCAVARDPCKNRNLIPYGILLKLSYSGTVFFYWFTSGVPQPWKPFAIIDLAFMIIFLITYSMLGNQRESM